MYVQVCHQRSPVFWSMPSWFTTTNEGPTTRRAAPVRSAFTSSAPFRNMEEPAWSGPPSPRSWLTRREQLTVGLQHVTHLLKAWHVTGGWLCCVPGVKVRKAQEEVEIHAPVIVSNCGIFTTFQTLLPPEIKVRTGQQQILFFLPKQMHSKICQIVSWNKVSRWLRTLPCFRYSGKTRHDETWQRIVLGLLRLWWDWRGAGFGVHQLLAVQEQRHGQVVRMQSAAHTRGRCCIRRRNSLTSQRPWGSPLWKWPLLLWVSFYFF